MRRKILILLAGLILSGTARAQSQDLQFDLSVAQPPLGNPSYGGALIDTRATPRAVGVHSTELGAGLVTGSADDASVTGLGVLLGRRWVLGPIGLRVPLALGALTGDAFGSDLNALAFSLSANVDVNVLALDHGSLQVFAGYGLDGARSSLTFDGFGGRFDVATYTLLHGPRVGAQAAIRLGSDFVVTPFYTLLSVSGTTRYSESFESLDFPRVSLTQFGLDVEYVPLGLSLSGLRQLGSDEPAVEQVDTFTLLLTFRFRDGGPATEKLPGL